MSGDHPMMTRGDREYRREKAVAAIRAGERLAAVRERFGLSVVYLRELARDAGVAHPVGRPRKVRIK